MNNKRRPAFGPGHYQVVVAILRTIPDEATRKAMADHFGTEFNKRSPSFDPGQWEKATGGRVAANSAFRRAV